MALINKKGAVPKEKFSRWGHENDGKGKVWVSASIQQIYNVNSSSQEFDADVWINCLYYDPRVKKNASGYKKGGYIDPDSALEHLDYDSYPVFHLMNDRGVSEVDKYIQIYDEPSIGSVLYCRRFTGTFSCVCDVKLFPFDSHVLPLKLYFNDCYTLAPSNDMPTGVFGTALHNNEWHICPHVSEEFSDGSGASGNAYRYYTVNLGVTREPTSYVINYMIPTSLLTLLGFVTLLFDGDELGERLGVILTLMLTHSALKIVLSAEVPKTSYLTATDEFVTTHFLLTGGMGLESISIVLFNVSESYQEDIESALKIIYLVLWAFTHLIILRAFLTSRKNAGRKILPPSKCEGTFSGFKELKGLESAAGVPTETGSKN
mmetsp:Transcript_30801/g.69136  ORF Transcript_30801/g.69136 Transcript_30801/m.69136 type:complete len:375 (+) Transcript_30801:159-1283(+)|eukprot:CAMPEP_0172624506 /NCGR_PEP_ID=MMETSP1068-20121228/137101_1 /TAXON_ID=35684 /ORGANISM="Pseudopedinella elastica, Strain CCMP716" /LENGTH=374 /DNA_ID=CAMNT_0013433487 /DNA_START=152 /DNA_END=1276 /DNA_ORIENTATION=+